MVESGSEHNCCSPECPIDGIAASLESVSQFYQNNPRTDATS